MKYVKKSKFGHCQCVTGVQKEKTDKDLFDLCKPAQSRPRCTKCNSPPTNGQCTNHRIAV